MIKSSHFVWLELKAELLSDIFVRVFKYLKRNWIEGTVRFQNPLSTHVSIYYFDKTVNEARIKKFIDLHKDFDEVKINSFNYFYRDWKEFIMFFDLESSWKIKNANKSFHEEFQEDNIYENTLKFKAHINFLRINEHIKFSEHKKDIENIITNELLSIKDKNIRNWKINLYAVNSSFSTEIQIKM